MQRHRRDIMYVVKANRVYKITEEEKQKFIDQGYEIAKLEKGKLVFEEVEPKEDKEIAKLKAEVKRLEKELEKANKGEGK